MGMHKRKEHIQKDFNKITIIGIFIPVSIEYGYFTAFMADD